VNQAPLHNKELRQQRGHQTFVLFHVLFLFFINLNCASGAAPQKEVAAFRWGSRLFKSWLLFMLIVDQVPLHNKELRQ
jgi:hypothetical protein